MNVKGQTVEVVRKRIKHLYVRVLAPDGRVGVSAPLWLPDRQVRLAVEDRWGWITRQQARMRAQKRQPRPKFVSGERHDYMGRPYLLDVVVGRGRPGVSLADGTVCLTVRPGSDAVERQRVLWEWYRRELKAMLPTLVARWEPVIGVRVAECRVRRMRTRWGSCNRQAHRIWVNLALATRPARCLEYVVVHETVHLLERRHNRRFWDYMGKFLPGWRVARDELSSASPDPGTQACSRSPRPGAVPAVPPGCAAGTGRG
jgi:predicted metal-dependent hydrolase